MRREKTPTIKEAVEVTPKPSPRLFAQLVEEYRPSNAIWFVQMTRGDRLAFKVLDGGIRQLRQMQQSAKEFAEMVEKGVFPPAQARLKEYKEAGREALVWCHMMAALSAPSEDVEAGTPLDFLDLQKASPVAWEIVRGGLQAHMGGIADVYETAMIDSAKKE
jgi:hypothetical protein